MDKIHAWLDQGPGRDPKKRFGIEGRLDAEGRALPDGLAKDR